MEHMDDATREDDSLTRSKNMTVRERFYDTLHFKKPEDRLPMVEWAPWWGKTLERWFCEGLSRMSPNELQEYFGLDMMLGIHIPPAKPEIPRPAGQGAGIIKNSDDYDKILPFLYQDDMLEWLKQQVLTIEGDHLEGKVIIRLSMEGFFWFPRTLFGIEGHLYAFYDQPELMHRINRDLAAFLIRGIHFLCSMLIPDMAGFAEDMSYNHGSMLSHDLFQEFLLPYYQEVIPHLKSYGIPVFVDSDGDITDMIPWLEEAGIDGAYPLECQAGVNICRIRERYPRFLMMGGYDKMVMPLGEKAMRKEFERILPVMRSGGYIPSVDHQTPPGVSLDDYRIYLRLFSEYVKRAVGQVTKKVCYDTGGQVIGKN